MPYSTGYFKTETVNYILSKYAPTARILDVGAGSGTYSDLLKPHGYMNMDCVEVFAEYIDKFDLRSKYKEVIVADITKAEIDLSKYDLIIMGDVLEHISVSDAKNVLSKMSDCNVIVAVPFESPQGTSFGNIHETHLQADLTLFNFFENYSGFKPLCLRFDYGVFVKKGTDILYVETGEKPMPDSYLITIKSLFPDTNVINISGVGDVKTQGSMPVTIVTALWNLGRDNISDDFKRPYDDYLQNMSLLLKADIPMYIFADKSDELFIWRHRERYNTVVNLMSLDELKTWFEFTPLVDKIRKNEEWLSQADWLRKSPQATLDGYNALVMSKMFMLNNVTIWNPFNSEYFFWIDGGITSTVSYGYFSHDKVFSKLPDFMEACGRGFVFLTFPYEGGEEIHGFKRGELARYANTDYVRFVCRGGFFGGKKETINHVNGLYYGYLKTSLQAGLMGTEESVFAIILYNHYDILIQFVIGLDGLVWPFFEQLKDKDYTTNVILKNRKGSVEEAGLIGLYVISFNSPKQFKTLCESLMDYDPELLDKTKKVLLNNSTKPGLDEAYSVVCDLYGFEEIKKDNIGICGGRQFIAEHAANSDLAYYMFFEDDMFFYSGDKERCKNGFVRKVPNFLTGIVGIMDEEAFDFLKFNFTEFYGDNQRQWAWHNVPAKQRAELFPEKPIKTETDDGNSAPLARFKHIKSYNGLPYATGEVFYCNWPQIVSRTGNKKMFLETTWAYPNEQTWMSYIYQQTVTGKINPGILLATPTEHNRFDFYEPNERKES